jgi:hypothetical protein
MKLNTAIAFAVAAAFAVPFAAQASAGADRIILAQTSGKITTDPKDSNPAAPPATTGTPRSADTTRDRPASGAAAGSSGAAAGSSGATTSAPVTSGANAPVTSGTNAADRAPNTPKAEAGATSRGGFSTMDKNNDGYISRDEAKDATWSNRFTELDKDNDGRLSQSEYSAMQAGSAATGATGSAGAPLTSGTNAPDRKPSTPKQ